MRQTRENKPKKEFAERLLEVRRVTKVTTWWRKMAFRAIMLIWNWKWKIWIWVAKWVDVSTAVRKAVKEAYKNILEVPITTNNTVPYMLTTKYKSCLVRLLPASAWTWLKAWSSVRAVLELAWYENVLSKIIWSNNKLNNALATIKSLYSYKHKKYFEWLKKWKKIINDEKKVDVEKKEDTKKVSEKKVSWSKKE